MNRALVKKILEHPSERLWTVQGFGKISTNITDNARLHIWDRIVLNPRVPAVHSHASDFESVVIVGCMRNLKMVEADHGEHWNKIMGGCVGVATLHELPIATYREGDQYSQTSEEIHWSLPDDGTVTLVEWNFFGPSPKPMKVFWRGHLPWQDAKPRRATDDEILSVTRNSLDLWF